MNKIDTKVKPPTASSIQQMTSTPMQNITPQNITKVLGECDSLVSALEAVGAMYGIPSSNIMIDDSLSSIRVVNDNIITPNSNNVVGNEKAIMRSIASVLDYISQRVDDKLDDYQSHNIHCKKELLNQRQPNPSKGRVIARYTDDEGGEIIAYDTGLVDMPNTRTAQKKVEQLRNDLKIPMYNPDAMIKPPSYFNDEDDITKGLDGLSGDDNETIEPVDVGEEIQESYFHLDLISQFDNTRYLGYDLLQSQGFDYIKPIDSVFTESKKIPKEIRATDISFMKFDNTQILKAIDFFNKAREEQPDAKRGELVIKKFINSDNYQKGLDCLCKQFNARIVVRYITSPGDAGNNLYTEVWKDIKNNMSISKSKGFQLGGYPITIFVWNKALDEDSPADISLFGQSIVSVFLHEIFHNIAGIIRQTSTQHLAALNTTMAIAANIRTPKNKRIFITNYVNTLDEFGGKTLNRITRRALVKQISIISTIQHNTQAMNELKKQLDDGNSNLSDKEIDEIIKRYETIISKEKKRLDPKKRILPGVLFAATLIGTIVLPGKMAFAKITLGSFSFIFGNLYMIAALSQSMNKLMRDQYKNSKTFEAFYCDMFAGMYQLPVTFLIGSWGNRKYVANEINQEKLNKLSMLEKEIYELSFSIYPSMSERNLAAVKVAKNTLDKFGKDIDPAIKKYLEWIVENYSSMLDTQIEEIYNTTTFDPKTADNLDDHLQTLITSNDLTLTEAAVSLFNNNDIIVSEYDNLVSVNDYVSNNDVQSFIEASKVNVNEDGDTVPENCTKCGSPIGIYLKGEPVFICNNKKCKKYYGVVKFKDD